LPGGRWAVEHGHSSGLGAGSNGARAVHVPLLGHRGPIGVVSVRPRGREAFTTPEPLRQLETFVNQTALALERTRLADEAQDARVRAETERLRSALLTSVSHDLRTPLAAITGAATTILESGARLDARVQQELLESIRDEAERLNRLVQNLLEMTRLESGALGLSRDWHPLEEVVGAALARLARGAGLGLAICQGIVKAHGGRIWAQNLPEGGVSFLFTLPLGEKPPASVPADA